MYQHVRILEGMGRVVKSGSNKKHAPDSVHSGRLAILPVTSWTGPDAAGEMRSARRSLIASVAIRKQAGNRQYTLSHGAESAVTAVRSSKTRAVSCDKAESNRNGVAAPKMSRTHCFNDPPCEFIQPFG